VHRRESEMTLPGAGGSAPAARAAVVAVAVAVAAALLLSLVAATTQAARLPQAALKNAHAMTMYCVYIGISFHSLPAFQFFCL
jgi:hypothetical protein